MADLHDISIDVVLKHTGGRGNQRLVDFAADGKTRMYLTAADATGRAAFTIAKGGEMEMLAKVSESDLAKLAALKTLNLGASGFTSDGVDQLRTALPNCRVEWR